MGVDRVASATGVLLVTGGADQNGVLHGSFPRGIQGPHVEDVDTLHLSEDFQTLDTGGLLEVGGDGTGLSTGPNKVVDGLDVCIVHQSALSIPGPLPIELVRDVFGVADGPIGCSRLLIGQRGRG